MRRIVEPIIVTSEREANKMSEFEETKDEDESFTKNKLDYLLITNNPENHPIQ